MQRYGAMDLVHTDGVVQVGHQGKFVTQMKLSLLRHILGIPRHPGFQPLSHPSSAHHLIASAPRPVRKALGDVNEAEMPAGFTEVRAVLLRAEAVLSGIGYRAASRALVPNLGYEASNLRLKLQDPGSKLKSCRKLLKHLYHELTSAVLQLELFGSS